MTSAGAVSSKVRHVVQRNKSSGGIIGRFLPCKKANSLNNELPRRPQKLICCAAASFSPLFGLWRAVRITRFLVGCSFFTSDDALFHANVKIETTLLTLVLNRALNPSSYGNLVRLSHFTGTDPSKVSSLKLRLVHNGMKL